MECTRSDRGEIAHVTCACHAHAHVAERSDDDMVTTLLCPMSSRLSACLITPVCFRRACITCAGSGSRIELAAPLPANKQRSIIPTLPLGLICMQKHVARLPSVNVLEDVLLRDEATMRMVGFYARQLVERKCRCGRGRRERVETVANVRWDVEELVLGSHAPANEHTHAAARTRAGTR